MFYLFVFFLPGTKFSGTEPMDYRLWIIECEEAQSKRWNVNTERHGNDQSQRA